MFLPPSLSANYTMQRFEVAVSSGLILDVMDFAPLENHKKLSSASRRSRRPSTIAAIRAYTAGRRRRIIPPTSISDLVKLYIDL